MVGSFKRPLPILISSISHISNKTLCSIALLFKLWVSHPPTATPSRTPPPLPLTCLDLNVRLLQKMLHIYEQIMQSGDSVYKDGVVDFFLQPFFFSFGAFHYILFKRKKKTKINVGLQTSSKPPRENLITRKTTVSIINHITLKTFFCFNNPTKISSGQLSSESRFKTVSEKKKETF